MEQWETNPEDDSLDENELPRQEDMDQDDGEPTLTHPCPSCGKQVYEHAEFCPHCWNYLTRGNLWQSKRLWLALIVVLLVASVLWWSL